MKTKRLSERSIALVCAVVLIIVSVAAAVRHSDWFADSGSNDTVQSAKSSQAVSSDDSAAPNDKLAQSDAPAKSTNVAPKVDTPAPAPQTHAEPAAPAQPKPAQPAAGDYSYTAAAGDSYTAFARHALQSYITAQQLTPTADHLLDAEVYLANHAGQPLLEVGQHITIAQNDIKRALQSSVVDASANTATPAPAANSPANSSKEFVYTATAGDSYTSLARQAVRAADSQLSPEQRVAAETIIATQAGNPSIQAGQQVILAPSAVQQAVSSAKALSPESQLAWAPYAAQIAW